MHTRKQEETVGARETATKGNANEDTTRSPPTARRTVSVTPQRKAADRDSDKGKEGGRDEDKDKVNVDSAIRTHVTRPWQARTDAEVGTLTRQVAAPARERRTTWARAAKGWYQHSFVRWSRTR